MSPDSDSTVRTALAKNVAFVGIEHVYSTRNGVCAMSTQSMKRRTYLETVLLILLACSTIYKGNVSNTRFL